MRDVTDALDAFDGLTEEQQRVFLGYLLGIENRETMKETA